MLGLKLNHVSKRGHRRQGRTVPLCVGITIVSSCYMVAVSSVGQQGKALDSWTEIREWGGKVALHSYTHAIILSRQDNFVHKPIFKVAYHSSTSISNEKIGSCCTPKPVSITEVVWSHYTHIFWELCGLVALHSWTLRRWGGNEARSRYTQVIFFFFFFWYMSSGL